MRHLLALSVAGLIGLAPAGGLKSVWTRVTRCFSAKTPVSWLEAHQRAWAWVARLSETTVSAGPRLDDAAFWSVECCIGSQPLSIVASSGSPGQRVLQEGALACYSLRLDLRDGPWLGGGTLLIGGREPSRLLA